MAPPLGGPEFVSAEYVSRRVIDGIEKNHHFIVTQPVFKPVLAKYAKRILEAFDYGLAHEEEIGCAPR